MPGPLVSKVGKQLWDSVRNLESFELRCRVAYELEWESGCTGLHPGPFSGVWQIEKVAGTGNALKTTTCFRNRNVLIFFEGIGLTEQFAHPPLSLTTLNFSLARDHSMSLPFRFRMNGIFVRPTEGRVAQVGG